MARCRSFLALLIIATSVGVLAGASEEWRASSPGETAMLKKNLPTSDNP